MYSYCHARPALSFRLLVHPANTSWAITGDYIREAKTLFAIIKIQVLASDLFRQARGSDGLILIYI